MRVDDLVAELIGNGLTVATAESLTGGAVCARLVDVPGASKTVRGGVCTYTNEMKTQILGVDAEFLSRNGPVREEVALAMAEGARILFGADLAISTTGVAGPGPADGAPAGSVWIACAHPHGSSARKLQLGGSRGEVRTVTVDAAIAFLGEVLTVLLRTRH